MEQIVLMMSNMLACIATDTLLCCNESRQFQKSLVCDNKKQNTKMQTQIENFAVIKQVFTTEPTAYRTLKYESYGYF